jgi:ElaB/YqjD/DUF883 family membrane-anchored ribosome-binding protein
MDKLSQLDQLIDDAEELLTKLADARNPEIQELRDRVDRAVNEARSAIANQADDVSDELLNIVNKIAAGIVLAGTVAFLAGSARGAKKGPSR